jgi:hypothetical protein
MPVITWSAITLPRGGDAGELVLALELVSPTVVGAVLLVLSVRTVSILREKFCYYLNFRIFFFSVLQYGVATLVKKELLSSIAQLLRFDEDPGLIYRHRLGCPDTTFSVSIRTGVAYPHHFTWIQL